MKTNASPFLLVLSLALFGAGAAQAASTWNFTGGGTESGANAFGNTRNYAAASGGGAVTVSAWSDTRNNSSGTLKNAYIESAYLGSYSGGLGVTNRDGGSTAGDTNEGSILNTSVPGHTMDNDTRYDSMLFDFGAGHSARLKSVTVGWWYNDSDITLLAYTGSGTPSFTSANVGYASLLSSGWSMVKSGAGTSREAAYLNAAGGAPAQSSNAAGYVPLAVNDLNVSARYWLIGALNTLVQALPAGVSDTNRDYVKISALSVGYGNLPEPSSALLTGVALAGLLAWRGRRSA